MSSSFLFRGGDVWWLSPKKPTKNCCNPLFLCTITLGKTIPMATHPFWTPCLWLRMDKLVALYHSIKSRILLFSLLSRISIRRFILACVSFDENDNRTQIGSLLSKWLIFNHFYLFIPIFYVMISFALYYFKIIFFETLDSYLTNTQLEKNYHG